MTISDLKELQALIKVCRKLGVNTIEVDGVKLSLGVLPYSPKELKDPAIPDAAIKVPLYNGPITEPDAIPTEGLTEDQLMFYSAQGHDQVEQ